MYGRNNAIAFCHINLSSEWPEEKLSYVLFGASVSSGVMSARVCVATTSGPICGSPG
jgi:hypothetical protein